MRTSFTTETVVGVNASKLTINEAHVDASGSFEANLLWRHAVVFGPYADYYGNVKTDVAYAKQYNTLVFDLYASEDSNAAIMLGLVNYNRYDFGVENTAVKYYDLDGNQTTYQEGKWIRVVVDLSALTSVNGDDALILLGVGAANSYIAIANAYYSETKI